MGGWVDDESVFLGSFQLWVGGWVGGWVGRSLTVEEPGAPFVREGLRPFFKLVGGEEFEEGGLGEVPEDHEGAERAPGVGGWVGGWVV